MAGSTLLFGVGIVLLAHVSTLNGFYLVEAVLGVAYGIYVGVDLALVVDVLPNPDDAGKDLGVFNMANALPQTLAPVFGAALLAVNSANQPELRSAALHRRRRGADRCPHRAPDQEGEVIPCWTSNSLLSELTVPEKASLTSGSGFWYTAPVDRLGIPKIMVSDGPHGLRAQPGEGDHLGLGGSLPATCFPTASAIASAWNPELLTRIGAGAGPGGPGREPVGHPRPRHQHEALTAVRTELRVLLRRPVPGR